jgi:hypothetical protein
LILKAIELDIWEPVPDKPGYVRYVEGRLAGEVYWELNKLDRHRSNLFNAA